MTTDVTITMIGYRGTGKTSYLLGMYRFMQFGQDHFTLQTSDPDDSKPLEDRWTILAKGGEDRWPASNSEVIETFQFDLDYGMESFMTLRWIDYDGGRIADSQSLPSVQELMTWLMQSSCVFLTVPGEYLSKGLSAQDATEKVQIQRINGLMKQLVRHLHPNHERPLPVAIVITKYDLCMASGRRPTEIFEDIKYLFDPLFAKGHRLWSRSPSYLTAICPVTLGVDIAKDNIRGTARPLYTEHPVFFAAWATLRRRIKEAEAAGKAAEEIADMRGKYALLADAIKAVPVYFEGSRMEIKPDDI